MALRFPKPRPRILDQRDAQRALEAHVRRVQAIVDRRDEKRCRCCGRRGDPSSLTALGRIHRAHIQDASRGGPCSPENLVSLCATCHALEHAKQLWFVGTNANLDADPPLQFDIHEAAVLEVFGTRELPPHVHIIAPERRVSS